MRWLALTLALLAPLPLAAQVPDPPLPVIDSAGPFDPALDASDAIAQAVANARDRLLAGDTPAPPQRVLAIFGANWCHDSRDLVAMLADPRVAEVIARHYQVVLIDAGTPQTGAGRNLDLAARLGVRNITGTPTMLVLDADGELLNSPRDARSWRNASSRSAREVERFLREWAKLQLG